MLQPIVAQELADVGVVLLFDVGLIVLAIGPGTGLLDALGLEPPVNVMVEELCSVVAVDSFQIKGL